MSSGLDDLTVQANQLVAAGDLTGAQELLDNALSAADPSPARASAELANAAATQARILLTLGEPHAARGWAAFAYSACTRLHGPSDARTVAAAATLAAVLHRVGSHARAGRLYREVIIELTATDGPESLRVLAAHADLATVEYARGECQVARDRLQDAWELHREVYGDQHPSGIKMLARLGAMQRDCGLLTEGYQNLALARELCRQHLPADHPLCAQIEALAEAPPDPRHACGVRPAADPEAPASAPEAPEAAELGPAPDLEEPDTAFEEPASAPDASHPAQPPLPPYVPRLVEEPTGFPEPAGYPEPTGYEASAGAPGGYAASTGEPGGAGQSPYTTAGEPPVTEEAAGVWRTSALPARREPARLPVPVPRAPRAPQRRLAPAVFVGLLAAVLGAIIVVAGFTLVADPEPGPPGGDAPPPPGPSDSPAASVAASPSPGAAEALPGAPPTQLRLRDGRDRVTLTWTYPPGAEGPLVISGGRAGQELRAFYDLPAGTTSYTVYNLDPKTNFCFSVAVVYSVDTVGRTKPVCTSRSGASSDG